MKKIFLITLFICTGAFASREYRVTAHGADLASLQTLRNCLEYSSCRYMQSSVAGDPGDFRFHSVMHLPEREFTVLMGRCKADRWPYEVTVSSKGSNLSIPPVSARVPSGPVDLRPAEMPEISDEASRTKYRFLQALVDAGKTDAAIRYALAAYRISLMGYKVVHTDQVDPSVSVTSHDSRTVSLGKDWTTNACSLFRALRHEAEHIHQIAQWERCRGEGTFSDHWMRERSAYLNDILSIRKFCFDRKEAARAEAEAGDVFLMKYTHSSGF